jgi:hypothetical protein
MDGPQHKVKLIVGQTNASLGSKTTRSDLADVCFEASLHENCKNVTFEIGTEKWLEGGDFKMNPLELFGSLSASWDDKMV